MSNFHYNAVTLFNSDYDMFVTILGEKNWYLNYKKIKCIRSYISKKILYYKNKILYLCIKADNSNKHIIIVYKK